MKVCFIGHRKIENEKKLTEKIYEVVHDLIQKGADTFLFGSRSEFDAVCRKVVTQLRKSYPFMKRIYVRAEYPDIDLSYRIYILKFFEDTYFPDTLLRAGRSVYIKRNQAMIDDSDVCIFYYNGEYSPPPARQKRQTLICDEKRKSGTAMAYTYAKKKKKRIINLYTE